MRASEKTQVKVYIGGGEFGLRREKGEKDSLFKTNKQTNKRTNSVRRFEIDDERIKQRKNWTVNHNNFQCYFICFFRFFPLICRVKDTVYSFFYVFLSFVFLNSFLI